MVLNAQVEAAGSRRPAVLAGCVIGLVVIVALFFGVFAGSRAFDDEGYMIVSLNGVATGHRLYTEVFSQYGPAFFAILALPLRLFGLEWTIEGARVATLGLTCITGLLMGIVASRASGVRLFGVAAGAMTALKVGGEAALHPTYLLLVLAAVALLGVTMIEGGSDIRTGEAVTGVAVALALLVKLNVGVLLAVVIAYAVGEMRGRVFAAVRPYLPLVLTVGLVGFALTSGNVIKYLLALSVPPLLFTLVTCHQERQRGAGSLPAIGFAAAIAGLGCVLVFVVGGTSVAALVRGVVIDPIRQPDAFAFGSAIGIATIAWLVTAAGLCGLARRRGLRAEVRLGIAVLVIACVAAQGYLYAVFRWDTMLVAAALCAVATPTPSSSRPAIVRALGAASVLLPLMSYPVAGRQTFASLVAMPAFAFVVIADAREALRTTSRSRVGRTSVKRSEALSVAGAAALAVVLLVTHAHKWSNLRPLTGAGAVRTSERDARAVGVIAASLQGHCDSFYSLPGLNSFYLLAHMEPPTQNNATAWMTLFDAKRQAAVVQDLEKVDRLCVVRNPELEAFWLGAGKERPGPLRGFLDDARVRVEASGDYEVFRFDE